MTRVSHSALSLMIQEGCVDGTAPNHEHFILDSGETRLSNQNWAFRLSLDERIKHVPRH